MSAQPFPASVWGGVRNLAEPELSPDATRVSYIAAGELAVVDVTGGAETWLPLFPRISHGHAWLPDSSGVIYAGKDGRIHRFEFSTALCRPITQVEHDISGLALSPDGTRVAYVDDFRDVLVADIDTGKTLRLSSDADFAFDPAWRPDCQYVAWHEWDVPNMPWDASRIVARKSDCSDAIIPVMSLPNAGVQQARFSPDGKRLGFLSDANGWLNIWTADAETFDGASPLVEENFEHGGPSVGPGQRSWDWVNGGAGVMYCRNEGGFGRLVVYDIQTQAKWPSENRDQYSSLRTRVDVTVAIREGASRMAEVELVTRTDAKTLARSSYSGLERAAAIPEAVQWPAEDGEQIHGRLFRAIDSVGPTPLILWVHGGPTHQSSSTMYARWSYFLQRGWSILVVDYRGTTGWGRAYAQALRGHWGELDVTDVAAGARAAVENGWARSDAVVPIGGSAGGFTVLWLLTRYPELWPAGITMYPVTDLIAAANDSWRFEAHYMDTLVGPLPESADLYRQRSPLEHAAKITKPLMILHGDADVVVPLTQAEAMATRLKKAGRAVQLHVYEGEGHGWRQSATRIDELERMEAFLNRYVLGVDSDGETEQ